MKTVKIKKIINQNKMLSIFILILSIIAIYFMSIIYQKTASREIMLDQNKENKVVSGELQKMVFAGGCFWCTEASYNPEYGVDSAVSGYIGGNIVNPSYEQVSGGVTGAREAVQVYFNPASTTIKKLLVNYWTHIDPTQEGGQFADIGYQYTAAIYYFTDEQKSLAEESKQILENSKKFGSKKIIVEIIDGKNVPFYPAEEYHQDYSIKNPVRYEYYKNGSGRTDFIKENWYGDKTFEKFLTEKSEVESKISDDEGEVFKRQRLATTEAALIFEKTSDVKKDSNKIINNKLNMYKNFTKEMKEARLKELTTVQYKVTQEESTEKARDNEYDKNYEKGIYVDIVSGEPLYLSQDKFDSGTGWPSFVKPINENVLTLKTDNYLIFSRTEIRSKIADSHLGHVFDDGPAQRGGKRYCMNSAAMRFVPLAQMETEGYGEYITLVK